MMPELNPWAVFWTAFFTALPVIMTQVLAHIRQMHGLKDNKETTQQVGAKAEEAVKISETTGSKIIAKATTIEEKANKIDERLNGGDNGLGARVLKNEARLESLETGQRSHDKAIEAVARSVDKLTLSFADFAASFKKTVESPADIRGETGGREKV